MSQPAGRQSLSREPGRRIGHFDAASSHRRRSNTTRGRRVNVPTEEFRGKVSEQVSKQAEKVSKRVGKVGTEVQQAIAGMKIPNKSDFEKLSKKFDKLSKAVERLEKKISSAAK